MSLESNQNQHHGFQAAKNNVSGSNDPHQLQHDQNEQLIRGAKRAAALQDLGIDEDDYLALQLSRGVGTGAEEARIERVMGPSTPVVKRAQQRVQQKALYEQRDLRKNAKVEGLPAELGLDQYFVESPAEFGQDQSALQNLTDQERVSDNVGDVATRNAVLGTDTRDPNSIVISEYKRRPGLMGRFQPKERVTETITLGETQKTPEPLQEAFKTRDFGLFQDDVVQRTAPDAQRALKAKDRAEGLSVVAGERQKRQGEQRKRLENEIAYKTQAGLGSIISAAAFDDAAMAELQSDARTAALLEEVFGNQVTAPVTSVSSNIVGDARMVVTPGSPNAYTYVDPRTGESLAVSEPPVFERANTPNTHQQLNAPVESMAVQDWVAASRPEFTLNPDAGFAYPQTDLTGTNQRVLQAINDFGQKNGLDPFQPAGPSLSMAELQQVVDVVNARAASPDGMIYRTREGQSLPVQPGTGTALTALGLNAREQQALAQMLIQSTGAKSSGIDTEAKRRYYKGEGSFRKPAEDIEYGVNIRGTAGGPKISSPTRAAAIASITNKGSGGKQRRAFRDAATNDVLMGLKKRAGEDASVAPGTAENVQGVAFGEPAGRVMRDFGYARPDQADAFMTDRYGSMSAVPDKAYNSLLKAKRDVASLRELEAGRAQTDRSIQQSRQTPAEPQLPAVTGTREETAPAGRFSANDKPIIDEMIRRVNATERQNTTPTEVWHHHSILPRRAR